VTFLPGFSCVTSQQAEECLLRTSRISRTEVERLNPSVINSFKAGLKGATLAFSEHVSVLGASNHLLFATSPGCPEPPPQSFLSPGEYLKAVARDKLRKGQVYTAMGLCKDCGKEWRAGINIFEAPCALLCRHSVLSFWLLLYSSSRAVAVEGNEVSKALPKSVRPPFIRSLTTAYLLFPYSHVLEAACLKCALILGIFE